MIVIVEIRIDLNLDIVIGIVKEVTKEILRRNLGNSNKIKLCRGVLNKISTL